MDKQINKKKGKGQNFQRKYEIIIKTKIKRRDGALLSCVVSTMSATVTIITTVPTHVWQDFILEKS